MDSDIIVAIPRYRQNHFGKEHPKVKGITNKKHIWLFAFLLLISAAVTAYFYGVSYIAWNVPFYAPTRRYSASSPPSSRSPLPGSEDTDRGTGGFLPQGKNGTPAREAQSPSPPAAKRLLSTVKRRFVFYSVFPALTFLTKRIIMTTPLYIRQSVRYRFGTAPPRRATGPFRSTWITRGKIWFRKKKKKRTAESFTRKCF